MAKPFETWTVFPHGPIEKLNANLWRVEAQFPGAPFLRNMHVARMKDGGLVIHNAIALGDDEMKALEAWGTPKWLIVPNGGHRQDARIWKQRYPEMKVIAPPGSKVKVEQIVKVDETKPELDDTVRYEVLDGTKEREGVMCVTDDGKSSLVFCDAVMNNRAHHLRGFGGFMMGLAGFKSDALKVTFPARMAIVADKKAYRAHLERLATSELARIDVAHGAPVTEGAKAALVHAASEL
jgi:hypothetical protein